MRQVLDYETPLVYVVRMIRMAPMKKNYAEKYWLVMASIVFGFSCVLLDGTDDASMACVGIALTMIVMIYCFIAIVVFSGSFVRRCIRGY
jgi:hypothetical protein